MTFVDRSLEALGGNIGDNKRNLQALEDHLRHLVPFVGAGLSVPIYPTWTELLLGMTADETMRQSVAALLRHKRYEEAAEEIFDGLAPKDFRAKAGVGPWPREAALSDHWRGMRVTKTGERSSDHHQS